MSVSNGAIYFGNVQYIFDEQGNLTVSQDTGDFRIAQIDLSESKVLAIQKRNQDGSYTTLQVFGSA